MCFIKKILPLIAVAIQSAFGQNFDSPILASYTFDCKVGDTFLSVLPMQSSEFQGEVASIGTNSIFQNTKSFKSNCFAKTHYVIFTSGKLQGAWFNIASNSASEIVLKIGSNDISKIEKSDTFKIVAHWTLDKLFPKGGGLKPSEGKVNGVWCSYIFKFTYFDEQGELQILEGINRAVSSVFYYLKTSDKEHWVLKNGDESLDVGSEIIEPNSFLILRNPEDVKLNISGEVLKAATILNFKNPTGEIFQDNFFASPSLTTLKISSFNTLIENGVMREGDFQNPKNSDFIAVFDNSSFVENRLASKIYIYKDGWYRLNSNFQNAELANSDVLNATDAIVFRFSGNAQQIKIVPDYAK